MNLPAESTDWIRPGAPIQILHLKPWKRDVTARGVVESFRDGLLTIRRQFRGGGTYDSLNLPKRDGDWGRIEIVPRGMVLRRTYYRADGTLIGELYNVQTPVKLRPGEARYVDLEVDVARWPDGRVEGVDLDDLDALERSGRYPRSMTRQARDVAVKLADQLRRGETWRSAVSPLDHS